MKPNHILTAIAAFALLFAGSMATAHDDKFLDTQKAPHGGQLRMAGAYHLELVVVGNSPQAKDNPVAVYVTDHAGTAIPVAGAKGTVTILTGKTKTAITLTPAGGNLLRGSGRYASVSDMKAVVAVTFPGKAPVQARFTPIDKAKGAQSSGHSGH
ncbi:MAG: hypothetical protein RLZZ09_781 [Pseudomonadota bacterium]|jgi:hypothetical protein